MLLIDWQDFNLNTNKTKASQSIFKPIEIKKFLNVFQEPIKINRI